MFVSYLHQEGYNVTVETNPAQVDNDLSGHHRLVYLLIGADNALDSTLLRELQSNFDNGTVSALIAEGNTTNAALLSTFGITTTGSPIVDPTSTFQNKEVFTVNLALGTSTATGVIDVAAPLVLAKFAVNAISANFTNLPVASGLTVANLNLKPVAQTSKESYDLRNSTSGPRTVAASGGTPLGSRAVVVADSAPFTNFLFNYTQGSVNEKAFVAAMLGYVDPGKGIPILMDASHYNAPKPPKFQAGLPIGPLVAYTMEQSLESLDSSYANFPSQVSGFLGRFGLSVSTGLASAIVALIVLLSVYGAVTRWFAPEKKGRDDRPIPSVERTIVAESTARTGFLQASRSKESYVATLAQLYECPRLDSHWRVRSGHRLPRREHPREEDRRRRGTRGEASLPEALQAPRVRHREAQAPLPAGSPLEEADGQDDGRGRGVPQQPRDNDLRRAEAPRAEGARPHHGESESLTRSQKQWRSTPRTW